MKVKKASVAAIVAVTAASFLAPASYAAQGPRGDKVNGCQAYIDGSDAWTNCDPATKSGQVATKAWCTMQPTRVGEWSFVGEGSRATRLALVGCSLNVHSAQTLWQ